jgi:hypothetical protein
MTKLQQRFAPLKRLLPRAVWQPLRSLGTGIITPLRFSLATGHWKSSMAMCAVTARGFPLPWYTYPAIDFLTQRNFQGCNILEIGGGQSTLWWSARARSVLTIEQDAEWCASLQSQIGKNVSLHHVPVDPERRSVAQIKSVIDNNAIRAFDVIVIDGYLRILVTALAFEYLAPHGAIILDDAERYGFYEETKFRKCQRIDFFGFAPGVSLRHCTSIVFVEDCFLLNPDVPIANLELMQT